MITEDYVSFETAKLLKEKGFDGECRDYYNTDGHFYSEDFKSNWNNNEVEITLFSAPTLQMAMKYLREVHKLNIAITRGPKGYHITIETIPLGIVKYLTREIVGITYVDSYEEACEAAIKYCLENLI